MGTALCAEMKHRTIACVPAVRVKTRPDQFQVGNIDHATDWSPALAKCDIVVHLAARVHQMQERLTDPLSRYRVENRDATLTLAQAAAAHNIRRFIFVSTIKVNGECTQERPFSADDMPQPTDAYAQSKFEAEEGLRKIGEQSGMEIVTVRPPLVYGPGVRGNFLRLMHLLQTGVPLPLGSVQNRRSLVALPNLIDFLLLCVTSPRAAGKTWLISDQHDLSTPELIRLVAAAMGTPSRLLPIPPVCLTGVARILGKGKTASRLLGSLQVDSTAASNLLGWKPAVSVEQAISATVNHFLGRPLE